MATRRPLLNGMNLEIILLMQITEFRKFYWEDTEETIKHLRLQTGRVGDLPLLKE
jgi:hypothetical protein